MFLAELGLGAAFGTDVVEFHIVSPLATDYGSLWIGKSGERQAEPVFAEGSLGVTPACPRLAGCNSLITIH